VVVIECDLLRECVVDFEVIGGYECEIVVVLYFLCDSFIWVEW